MRFRNDVRAGRDVRWRHLGETNNYRVTGNTPSKHPTSKGHRETGRQADRQIDRQITAVELFPEIKQYWLRNGTCENNADIYTYIKYTL